MSTERNSGATAPSKSPWLATGIILVIALAGVGWAYFSARASERERERTANALQLQVLASRLGVAAFEAEYGDFETARGVASEAFDGIANYGIEQGALPEDYADVLVERDDVIAGIATRDPGVGEQLMALFFGLQVPVDTELDPSHILPAADSGLGLEPPRRRVTPIRPDSLLVQSRRGTVSRDSVAAAPTTPTSSRDTIRESVRDTLPSTGPDTLPAADEQPRNSEGAVPRRDSLPLSAAARR